MRVPNDDLGYSGIPHCRETHHAGLAAGIDSRPVKPCRAEGRSGEAEGHQFRMCCRVVVGFHPVRCARDDLAVTHQHSSEGLASSLLPRRAVGPGLLEVPSLPNLEAMEIAIHQADPDMPYLTEIVGLLAEVVAEPADQPVSLER